MLLRVYLHSSLHLYQQYYFYFKFHRVTNKQFFTLQLLPKRVLAIFQKYIQHILFLKYFSIYNPFYQQISNTSSNISEIAVTQLRLLSRTKHYVKSQPEKSKNIFIRAVSKKDKWERGVAYIHNTCYIFPVYRIIHNTDTYSKICERQELYNRFTSNLTIHNNITY